MDSPLVMLPVLLLHGLVYGMLIFLVASGLTLVLGLMDILNFAHVSVYMIGAFLCFQIIQWTGNFWLALVVAPVVCAFLGILIDRFLISKIHGSGHLNELLATFGLAMVITEVINWIYGSTPLPVPTPGELSGALRLWADVRYPLYRLFILALAGLVLAFMFYILKKTRLGISIRASVEDGDMANALGTDVATVSMVVMGIGAWLAGIAGVIIAPYLSVYPGMYADMITDCFAVIAVGGLGSLGGAFVASLLVGQIQSLGVIFIPRVSIVLIYLLMAAVFTLKPSGLFGKKE
ncbi:MAG: branched-chain amino acid ABC transporter permease [Deltaproteobacteria bacterium]|nr:branched-chain amino acid ABC transporter permease [Deltaproteobacteria bacterium]